MKENDSVWEMVDKLRHPELASLEGTKMQVQQDHKSLRKKPSPGATPRSRGSTFSNVKPKKKFWWKLGKRNFKLIGDWYFFDQDFSTEVMKKCKSCIGIKKDLKILVLMPLTKIWSHWLDGPKIYENTEDAAWDTSRLELEIQVNGLPLQRNQAETQGVKRGKDCRSLNDEETLVLKIMERAVWGRN